LSAPWTIGLTAAAFAAIHGSPTFLPLAFVVGIAAGWLRERTGSVVVTMAAHSLQSLLVVALSLALTGWDTPALLG
jgi:membrane protease YdiL (CAAX protease family)